MLTRRYETAGLVAGRVGRFGFEARLTQGIVSYGIHRRTLYKGNGRIARLRIWRLGPAGELRTIALFDHGWRFGRRRCLSVVRTVVETLDGR